MNRNPRTNVIYTQFSMMRSMIRPLQWCPAGARAVGTVISVFCFFFVLYFTSKCLTEQESKLYL